MGVDRNHGTYGSADDAAAQGLESDVFLCVGISHWRACRFGDVTDGRARFRFGLAGAILSGWALIARVTWPTGRTLAHVLVTGLLTQALQFICLYLALMHGAPAVLGAVVISMNPVVTAVLATVFLGEGLT